MSGREPEDSSRPQEPNGPRPRVRVRKEVRGLGSSAEAWDPVMEAYARAVATMAAREPDDPTSWDYQAAIHGRNNGPLRPLYRQCQHATWFFLPWHRMYLYRFEQIVRGAVVAAGGPKDWALPYWNYELPGDAKALPWVFRTTTLPDGTPNPLLVPARRSNRNQGEPLPDAATSSAAAMTQTQFTVATPNVVPGFGGPQTGAAHFGSGFGALESSPHNIVHVQVGGWMSDPGTAAFDPIFWLHHANIDRLWEVWIRTPHVNTTLAAWRDQQFELFDESGARVAMRCADVVDIEGQLGYTYEELPAAPTTPARRGLTQEEDRMTPPAEVVGATDAPVVLGASVARTAFGLREPTGPARRGLTDEPRRVYLTMDNIAADAPPSTSYQVVLDMGDPAYPADDYVVGVVSFFGVVQANQDDQEEAPHGLRFTFDITDLVERLQERGVWNGENVSIRFDPIEAPEDEDRATQVEVGRVSVAYS